MSALSELLSERLPEGWSVRQVAAEAERRNVHLPVSTATAYFAGKHGVTPREQVLQALAQVLPVTITELRKAAGVPAGDSGPYNPPAEAARLSARQRRALDELIRSFVASERQGTRHDQEQEPGTEARSTVDGSPARPAGRRRAPTKAEPAKRDDYGLARRTGTPERVVEDAAQDFAAERPDDEGPEHGA